MKTFEAESLGIDRKSQGGTDDAEKKIILMVAKYLLSTYNRA